MRSHAEDFYIDFGRDMGCVLGSDAYEAKNRQLARVEVPLGRTDRCLAAQPLTHCAWALSHRSLLFAVLPCAEGLLAGNHTLQKKNTFFLSKTIEWEKERKPLSQHRRLPTRPRNKEIHPQQRDHWP